MRLRKEEPVSGESNALFFPPQGIKIQITKISCSLNRTHKHVHWPWIPLVTSGLEVSARSQEVALIRLRFLDLVTDLGGRPMTS